MRRVPYKKGNEKGAPRPYTREAPKPDGNALKFGVGREIRTW